MKRVYIMALLYSIALSASSILSFRKQHQGEEEVEALYFKALHVPEVQDVEEDTSRGMLFALQGTTKIVPVEQIVLVRHKEGKPRKPPTTIVPVGQIVLVRQLEEENLEVQHVEEETFSGMLSNLQKGTSQETTIVLDGQFVLVRQLEFQSDEYGWKHAPASKNYVEGDDL